MGKKSLTYLATVYLSFTTLSIQADFVQIDFNGMQPGPVKGQTAVGTGVTGSWGGKAGMGSIIDLETDGFTELAAPEKCKFTLRQSSGESRALKGNSLGPDIVTFSTPLGGKGRRVWGSFLLQTSGKGSAGIGFDADVDSYYNCFGNADQGLNMWLKPRSQCPYDKEILTTNGSNLVVFRIEPDYLDTRDRLDVWINPDVTRIEEETITFTVLNQDILSNDKLTGLKYFSNGNEPSTIDLITLSDNENAYAEVTGFEGPEPSPHHLVQIDFNGMELGDVRGQPAKGRGVRGNWTGGCQIIECDLQAPEACHFRLKQKGQGRALTGVPNKELFTRDGSWIPISGVGQPGKAVWGSCLLGYTRPGSGAIGFDGTDHLNSFGATGNRTGSIDLKLWVNGSCPRFTDAIEEGTNLLLFRIRPNANGSNDSIEIWVNPDVRTINPDEEDPVKAGAAFYWVDDNILPYDFLKLFKFCVNGESSTVVDLVTLSDGPDAYADVTGYDRSKLGTALILK